MASSVNPYERPAVPPVARPMPLATRLANTPIGPETAAGKGPPSLGGPAPGSSAVPSKQIKPLVQQPPRQATKQDFDRMMEASSARSGKASQD
jgi:hypothetical protein